MKFSRPKIKKVFLIFQEGACKTCFQEAVKEKNFCSEEISCLLSRFFATFTSVKHKGTLSEAKMQHRDIIYFKSHLVLCN